MKARKVVLEDERQQISLPRSCFHEKFRLRYRSAHDVAAGLGQVDAAFAGFGRHGSYPGAEKNPQPESSPPTSSALSRSHQMLIDVDHSWENSLATIEVGTRKTCAMG